MASESRFQTVIQGIRDDPQKFIYGQFAPGGAFERCPVTRGDLDCIPIIMRLLVHERLFLAITVWESDEFGYSRETYRAYNSWKKPETWEYKSTAPPAYTDVDDEPEFMPAYAQEDADGRGDITRLLFPRVITFPNMPGSFRVDLRKHLTEQTG